MSTNAVHLPNGMGSFPDTCHAAGGGGAPEGGPEMVTRGRFLRGLPQGIGGVARVASASHTAVDFD